MSIGNEQNTAIEASKEETFSFLDRLTGRNYPTEEVVVYLDEAGAHKRNKLVAEIEKQTYLLKADDKAEATKRGRKITLLQKRVDEIESEIKGSRVVFHLEGIPSEEYDAIVDESVEEFPIEYTESRNPISMALERTPKENPDRDVFFRTRLWAAFVRKVSDATGAADHTRTPEYMGRVMGVLPIVGVAHVQMAIESLRMTTDWMDQIQDDDFFPKS